jgi:predicted NAD-dependent protein-ADP-ribosyltransferase YbiA (DUF1768 family)
MRVILQDGRLIVAAEDDAERELFAVWRVGRKGHVFFFDGGSAKGGAMHDLGPQEDACREPINIVFDQVEARLQPISNLASTPFRLGGRTYASVEGFWQGLRFELDADRVRVAALCGKAAKRAAEREPPRETFVYDGQTYARGGPGHRGLMLQAVRAKFSQHRGAREALLATGERPLEHRTRRDSETIPGALMADMWMRLRKALRSGRLPEALDGGEAASVVLDHDTLDWRAAGR